jgi:hypothetical protein
VRPRHAQPSRQHPHTARTNEMPTNAHVLINKPRRVIWSFNQYCGNGVVRQWLAGGAPPNDRVHPHGRIAPVLATHKRDSSFHLLRDARARVAARARAPAAVGLNIILCAALLRCRPSRLAIRRCSEAGDKLEMGPQRLFISSSACASSTLQALPHAGKDWQPCLPRSACTMGQISPSLFRLKVVHRAPLPAPTPTLDFTSVSSTKTLSPDSSACRSVLGSQLGATHWFTPSARHT